MNNFYSKLAVGIFMVCILVACAGPSGSVTTPIPTDTNLVATWTPRPSVTPYPAPTRRPAQSELVPTTVPSVTEAAQATLQAHFGACDPSDESKLSPKKDWYICGSGSDFAVIHKDGNTWKFSVQEQFGVEYYGDFSLLRWTTDEKFLYFAVMNPLDGVDPITVNAEALFRMDLSSGVVTTVLGGIGKDAQNQRFYTVSISPTGRRLVYASGYPQEKLHIIDLQNSDEKVIPIEPEYTQIGDFTWSEDGLRLAYKLYANGDLAGIYSYSIRLLNLTDFSAITFIKNVGIGQSADALVEFSIVSVSSEQVVLKKNDEIWKYNVEKQKLELQAGNGS